MQTLAANLGEGACPGLRFFGHSFGPGYRVPRGGVFLRLMVICARMADPTFEPYGGVAPRWAGPRGGRMREKTWTNFQHENTNLSL